MSRVTTPESKAKKKIYTKKYDARPEAKLKRKSQSTTPKRKLQRRILTLKHDFDITLEQYNYMYIKQNGCCAICNKPQSSFKHALAVDHDHKTGKVRGLLCINCNLILGHSNDSIERLTQIIQYLNKHITSKEV